MNPVAYVKSLKLERDRLAVRIADIDRELTQFREALWPEFGADWFASTGQTSGTPVHLPPQKVNGHSSRSGTTPTKRNNRARVAPDEVERRIFASLALREPQTQIDIEEDAEHGAMPRCTA